MTLEGSPWKYGGCGLHVRSMLAHLLACSASLGYRAVASGDISARYMTDSDSNPHYPLDVHSIYLVKIDSSSESSSPPSYEEVMKL